ncbi:MAG TPA: carboxypeptidase regulatory-like domain-containing protein [Thermoanaerobaculia bacterium]|nr:carboxypeptidase regulatory-like domain-containing protein [Thermoanaerobaculia bacterium]
MPTKRIAVVSLALALFALPSLAAITGSVMTADGKPVAGARVSTYGDESPDARFARLLSDQPERVPLATTQTDAKGAFSIESPKSPTANLRVSLHGYAPDTRSVEREEDGLVFILEKVELRSGTVKAGGKPVANATVVVRNGGDTITKTDAEGRYEAPFSKRLSGITVLHPDYAVDNDFFFNLGENALRTKLDRTLQKGGTLTGRVVASDGKTAVAGAAIAIDGWPSGTSGEDGTFTLAHVPAKWSSLIARKDTLIARRTFSKEANLTLKLEKAATFSGRVLDAKTKMPVAGSYVGLGSRGFARSDSLFGAIVDAKGTYSILAPQGSYVLTAAHPGYDGESADVEAASGQTASRDVTMQPLVRISGIVVDEGNKPVAAASVASEATGDPMMMMSMRGRRFFNDSVAVASGPDGKFSLRTNGDRELKIRASKKGLPSGRTEAMKVAAGERKSGIVVTLPSGIAVSGKITDADGKPLSGVTIGATETQGRGSEGGVRRTMIMIGANSRGDDESVQTASDGTFAMRLKEGVYDFTANRDGYATKTIRAFTVTASGTEPMNATLDPAVQITGRVTRGGTGIEGVSLFVFGGGSGGNNTTTGPDGSFTLENLTPGQVGVFVTKEGDFIQEQRMLTAPSRDVVLEFPAGGRVSGRVVEKGTRRPLTSFEAGISRSRGGGPMVMMGPPQTKPFTSDDGSFVLDNVPSGSVTLVANAPGFVSGRVNLTVEEGKTLDDVIVELDTGVKLTGRVTGPNGSALPDVSVRLAPSTTGGFAMRGTEKSATTDSNGEYTMDGLNAGDETITFAHSKYLSTSKQVTLKGRETRLDVQLEGGTRVSGIVVTEAGVPVADAEVRAMAPGAGFPTSVATNASGTFEFESLQPVRYRITANRTGYAEGVVEDYDVANGGQLRITLKTGSTIYGRVTGLNEQELANTFVMARGSGAGAQTPVDSTGSYRIEGAPVGNVSVSASVRGMTGGRSSAAQTVTLTAGGSMQVDIAFRSDVAVRGRVTRNGTALGNAQVMFMPRSGGQTNSANTDAGGNYSITGLEDGNYMVNVIDMGRIASYSTTYEVRGSSTFDIDYTVASVRGRVVEAGSNRPIGNVNVTMRATSAVELFRGRSAVTDENGVFVIDTVPAGSYAITASLSGFGADTKELTVGQSNIDNVELHLAQSDGVTLKVVDGRDGRALPASAVLYDLSGHEVQTAGSQFLFGVDSAASSLNIPASPGQYIATVYTQNYAPVHVSVNAPSTRTVALTRGGRIEIESKHGEPVKAQLLDAFNIAYPRIGPIARKYTLIPRAVTPLDRIAPGRYTLQLLGADEMTVVDQVQVVVTDEQTVRVEI